MSALHAGFEVVDVTEDPGELAKLSEASHHEVVAPPPVLEKINLGKQAADLCTSTLSQLMVQAYFEESRWRDYVESLTEIYRARRDTMLDALAAILQARHPDAAPAA